MNVQPARSTEEQLLAIWQDLFETPSVGPDDSFFVLGGYSLLAARLAVRVHEAFGVELSPHQIFETPTVAQLAADINKRLIAEHAGTGSISPLVPIQSRGSRVPFFCIHSIIGTVFVYQPLAQLLGPDQPVYGVEAQGLVSGEQPLTTMPDMVTHCVEQIRTLQPHGPYHLGGYSFSGLLALEIARCLEAAGEHVALLALFDTWLMYHPTLPRWLSVARQQMNQKELRFRMHLPRIRYHVARLLSLQAKERLLYVGEKMGVLMQRVAGGGRNSVHVPVRGQDEQVAIARLNHIQAGAVSAVWKYTVSPYAGHIIYFQSMMPHWMVWFDQPKAWARLARGGLEIHHVPGVHDQILHEPNVQTLATFLGDCLERTSREKGRTLADISRG